MMSRITNRDDDKEEHWNIYLHVKVAFDINENIKMNENFIDEYINNRECTPLFTSVFYNKYSK